MCNEYLKNWMPITFTNDLKKIEIVAEFSIYENMTVALDATKTPPNPVAGTAVAYYKITEDTSSPRGNKYSVIVQHTFVLSNDWSSMAPHFSGILVNHPDVGMPEEGNMKTGDAPIL